jgi:hypothetical protein
MIFERTEPGKAFYVLENFHQPYADHKHNTVGQSKLRRQ